jgi:phosphoserine phosphatase RsbU/P
MGYGEVVEPEVQPSEYPPGSSTTKILKSKSELDPATEAAAVLVAYLFAQGDRNIPGISYAVEYHLAEVHSGGDIVDVYQFDNGAVALSIADISGKGPQAAIHAALIKYGLRAYASHGLTPEKTMRAMDRLYLENSTFENIESFASVFFAIVDSHRRILTYASAGHEPVVLIHPHLGPKVLAPTAPIIGVFEDQHHLFRQESLELWPGSLLVATTDGVTEMRNALGEFYGMDRLLACIERSRNDEPGELVDRISRDVRDFSAGGWHDDVAILSARFA